MLLDFKQKQLFEKATKYYDNGEFEKAIKIYQILEKNWRFKKAEIDIIAKKNSTIIAVEVKTRTSNYFGNPQDFVKPKQIRQMVKAINNYVETENLNLEIRFDILAVVINKSGTRIEHIQDAFLYF